MKRILLTGANGQIGSDLAALLCKHHPDAHVLCTDLADTPAAPNANLPYEPLDVRDAERLQKILIAYDIDTVFHLASLLSAAGEKTPDRTWEVNMSGLKHVLDAAKERDLHVFWPSSIAVFGPASPTENAAQQAVLDPQTMYGITKVSGELLCRYYHAHFGVDVRSIRYPGLISHTAPPGGGATDFAVAMLVAAARGEAYQCFVRPDTRLPMMYMPDALRAALRLMQTDADRLHVRTSYNISGLSFSAQELADTLRAHCPDFRCLFAPDERQEIADSWPASIHDGTARRDWGWQPRYDTLGAITDDMLDKLRVTR